MNETKQNSNNDESRLKTTLQYLNSLFPDSGKAGNQNLGLGANQ